MAGGGGGRVDKFVPAPNPQSGPAYHFGVFLTARCESLKVKVYSRTMQAVAEMQIPGSWQPGWNQLAVPLPNLEIGLYYVLIRGDQEAAYGHKPAFLMVIR